MTSYDVSLCSAFIIDSSLLKKINSKKHQRTSGEFITPTPKMQTVAENECTTYLLLCRVPKRDAEIV